MTDVKHTTLGSLRRALAVEEAIARIKLTPNRAANRSPKKVCPSLSIAVPSFDALVEPGFEPVESGRGWL